MANSQSIIPHNNSKENYEDKDTEASFDNKGLIFLNHDEKLVDQKIDKSSTNESEVKTPTPPVPNCIWRLMLVGGVFLYSSYTILVHLCEKDGKMPFSYMAVVLSIEALKLVLSAVMFLMEVVSQRKGNAESFFFCLLHRLKLEFSPSAGYEKRSNLLTVCLIALPFSIPAILYTINNNLGLAIQLQMDPATYQVLGNFKILSTAVLFRLIIKRPISPIQWFSLCLIMTAGIINGLTNIATSSGSSASVLHITPKGVVMISFYCTISGLSGVYTEYVLKNRANMSLNVQNALLYIFGIAINGALFLADDWNSGGVLGFFDGFNAYTWLLIVTQAFLGIFMGFVMKYSNNIVRLFIISSAMILTTVLSVLIFGLVLKISFVVSALLVILAIFLYQK